MYPRPPLLNGTMKLTLGLKLPLESTEAPMFMGVPTDEPGKIVLKGSITVFKPNDPPCSERLKLVFTGPMFLLKLMPGISLEEAPAEKLTS